jgi:hypothetical protein
MRSVQTELAKLHNWEHKKGHVRAGDLVLYEFV